MNILETLLNQLTKTDHLLVYKAKDVDFKSEFPLFVCLIGPSGAGKDSIKRRLMHTGRFFSVLTATNRPKRPDEAETEYIWMRSRHANEPEQSYLRYLIKENDLFEYDYHYGSLYGTPVQSIKNAFKSRKIPLFCAENQGARYMQKELSKVSNVLIIMIVPDSLEDLERRILAGSRNNPTKRLTESFAKLADAPHVAHFVVVNPANAVEPGKSGLQSAVTAVKKVISGFA